MSSAADRIAELETQVNALRTKVNLMEQQEQQRLKMMEAICVRAGFPVPRADGDAARKAPKRRPRRADAEVIPLRRRAR
jgi:hypothetical protein